MLLEKYFYTPVAAWVTHSHHEEWMPKVTVESSVSGSAHDLSWIF